MAPVFWLVNYVLRNTTLNIGNGERAQGNASAARAVPVLQAGVHIENAADYVAVAMLDL